MILVYVLSVIMMEYMISYKEIRYLVNRIWHTVCCALYTKLLTATQYSSEYLFFMLMVHPINHNQDTKEACVSFIPSIFMCTYQSITTFNPLL